MKYFIQVENGEPRGVVFSEQNLYDLSYSPNQLIGHPVFYELIREPRPVFALEDFMVVATQPRYEVSEGVVKELWDYRHMTPEEVAVRKADIRQGALNLISVLEDQAKKAIQNPNVPQDKKDFLASYLNDLEALKSKPDLNDQDAASIKLDIFNFTK